MTRSTGPDQDTQNRVRSRDRDRCRRCGAITRQIHHRKPRGMGGTTDPSINLPSNLVLLCGSGTTGCHGWVETNRREARALGWLVSQWADPAAVPILQDGRATYLTEDGTAVPGLTWKDAHHGE